jgi:hypothetical protein
MRTPSFSPCCPIQLIAPWVAALIQVGGAALSNKLAKSGGGQGNALTAQSQSQINTGNEVADLLRGNLATGSAGDQGFRTLREILGQKGATDPLAFNRQLTGIGRDTEAVSRGAEGRLARLGLQNSGVGQALLASIESGGADRLAGARSDEVQRAEQRKRRDLELLINMLINPAINIASVGSGAGIAGAQLATQQHTQQQGQQGDILNSLTDALANIRFGSSNATGNAPLNTAPPGVIQTGPTTGNL